jgi:formiminoglutamase
VKDGEVVFIGPGGMESRTLLEAIEWLGEQEEVKAMDIVEIDPTLDFRDMTSRIGAHVLLAFLKGTKKGGWICVSAMLLETRKSPL